MGNYLVGVTINHNNIMARTNNIIQHFKNNLKEGDQLD